MKIQEALSKVKELKADAHKRFKEVEEKKEKTIYLGIEDKYDSTKSICVVDDLIEEAISKLAYAHDLKLAIQKANALVGVSDLIQEKDFLLSVCVQLEPLTKLEQETDPILDKTGFGSQTVFLKKKALFDTEEINKLYDKAIERVRKIEIELQQKNWEFDIDELVTPKFMNLLNDFTT